MTPWTVARRTPLSMGFSRQEYCSGLSFPSPGDLPQPGIKAGSPALQADSLPTELPGKPPGNKSKSKEKYVDYNGMTNTPLSQKHTTQKSITTKKFELND